MFVLLLLFVAESRIKMEDLSTWSVDHLIQLHTDMDAVNKDLFKVSGNFYQKQESIRILIEQKLDITRADMLLILNGKRLKEENERSFFYEQERERVAEIIKKKDEDYMDHEQMLKEMLKQIVFITGKLESIKKDNQEINNFMSIQTKLFCKMAHKMNGVGVFLLQIVDIKKSSAKNKRNGWMNVINCL